MSWPNDHKSTTRARIVAAAAAVLREKGVAGVSVAEIMGAAGLTQGGFYAHFKSKDDLVGAAVERAGEETLDLLGSCMASAPDDQRVHAVIDAYLSRWHAKAIDQGCPLPPLGTEVARLGGTARRRLARSIQERIAWVRRLLPNRASADEDAIGAVACMLGGVMLARMLDGEQADTVREAVRAFAHRALDADG